MNNATLWETKEATTLTKITGATSCNTSICLLMSAWKETKARLNTSRKVCHWRHLWPSYMKAQWRRIFCSSHSLDLCITPLLKTPITRKSIESQKWSSGMSSETSTFQTLKATFLRKFKRQWSWSSIISKESISFPFRRKRLKKMRKQNSQNQILTWRLNLRQLTST